MSVNRIERITGSTQPNFVWALAILVVVGATLAVAISAGAQAENDGSAIASEAELVVFKSPYCGCCHKWIDHLRESGLTVAVKDVASTQPVREEVGVPPAMASCHTAVAGEYWIEGHVPADIIKELLDKRPSDINGVAVPGMPAGSPGMEGPNAVTYDIVAYGSDGKSHVYATRQGHLEPHQE